MIDNIRIELPETDKEAKRLEALNKVNDEYYNSKSPHYRDNERYSWAVNEINKRFDDNDY